MVAQKVLLLGQRLGNGPVRNSLHRGGFKRSLIVNTKILKRHEVSRGKISGRETQPYKYNLTTKGRNPRQINE